MIKNLSAVDREVLMAIAEEYGIVADAVEHIDALEKEVERLRDLAKAADEHRLEMIRWAAKKAEQHPALRPYDGIPEVGERVWWDDPDGGACSGWHRVVKAGPHYEDAVQLAGGDGSLTEVFCHELYREVRA